MLNENVIPFLTDLSNNNNKEWFTKNKPRYQKAHNDFINFIDELIPHMAQTNPALYGLEAKNCVFRIYRDVRFAKDKTPYKSHFGAYIAPGGRKSKYAGFYIHIEPAGSSFTGGGIYSPEAPILKALRTEFYQVPDELFDILESKAFKKHYNDFWSGDKLKMAPKGFPKDFEHIDLLKHKSYIVDKQLTNADISADNFLLHLIELHKTIYPLNRLLNTIIDDANL